MIQIMSRPAAINYISKYPDHPIIAIGETTNNGVEKVTEIAKNCLCLMFDDIELNHIGRCTVQPEHIKQAVEWATDKPDLIIACRAGISRSSALAYVIESTRVGPEKALEILDMNKHQPNRLVIHTASQILGGEIMEVYNGWMGKLWGTLLSWP